MDKQIVTLIPGDGIGPETSRAMQEVVAASGANVEWEVAPAGAACLETYGTTLPDSTLESIKRNKVAVKGPLTTPVGTGFRSINVALRQALGLYVNLRPVVSLPGAGGLYDDIDLVIVRENTEDLYAGIEFEEGSAEAAALIDFVRERIGREILPDSGISIKPISISASRDIVEFAFNYAAAHGRRKVTAVHKANIMKFSDGLFLHTAREVAARQEAAAFGEGEGGEAAGVGAGAGAGVGAGAGAGVGAAGAAGAGVGAAGAGVGAAGAAGAGAGAGVGAGAGAGAGAGLSTAGAAGAGAGVPIEFDDKIIDAFCMNMVMNPWQFDVIVFPNLYGDIASDLAAGLVGGLGIAPGANIGREYAVFEAVHGSAPDIAGQNKANPTAEILSAAMMLDHIGQTDAAGRIRAALRDVYAAGEHLTGDISRSGGASAHVASTTEFTQAVCDRLAASA